MLLLTKSGLKGANLYEYCDNNVVNKADSTGKWSWICAGLASAVIGVLAYKLCNVIGVNGKTKALIISAFAVFAGVIGGIFGPRIIKSIAAKIKKVLSNITRYVCKNHSIVPKKVRSNPFDYWQCKLNFGGLAINGTTYSNLKFYWLGENKFSGIIGGEKYCVLASVNIKSAVKYTGAVAGGTAIIKAILRKLK